jgi:pyruvate dehydrogenase E2 component (dihydrolipoamide acetyltransferase)
MAEIVRMPKLSDTMTDGVVAKWHKKIGDKVKNGELLADIETDKATMEFESFQDGVLLHIGVEEGKGAPVDSILAILGNAGEDVSALLKADTAAPAVAAKEEIPSSAPAPTASAAIPSATPVAVSGQDGRLKASPLAKKMAEEKGIDIRAVKGSGDDGRIIRRDIENFKETAKSARPAFVGAQTVLGQESFTEEPVSQMRKTIARRLSESKHTAPHFYLKLDIDMEKAWEARAAMNEISPSKISFNDIVIKAVSMALRQHPKVNSSWLGDKIRYNNHVHIGVAIAVEEGLLVPVVRFADQKSLSQIATEVKDYGKKAKEKKLQPSDWEGNTFTISNLGMFGIDDFTAIINTPDACILAVGAIRDTPVVKNGAVVPGKLMTVSLSCDHRVVDGSIGAAFLQTLKTYLENPVMLLV